MLSTLFLLPLLLPIALAAVVPPRGDGVDSHHKSRAGTKRGRSCPKKGTEGGSGKSNDDSNQQGSGTADVSHLQVGELAGSEVRISNKQVEHPGPGAGGGNNGEGGGSDPNAGDTDNKPKASEKPKDDKSKDDKPKNDKPKDDKPKDDKPKDDKPKDPAPTADKPKATEPKPSSDPSGSGGGGGDKAVGLGWNPAKNSADLSTYLSNGLGWYYQWDLKPTWPDVSAEFVPMVWGADGVSRVKDAMAQWPASTKHVLSFNEPDISGQAKDTLGGTANAAKLHNQISAALGSEIQLGSPAVTSQAWLEEWEVECKKTPEGLCRHDFIAYHFYGVEASALIDTLKVYTVPVPRDPSAQLHKRFDKKIWVTECGCHVFGDKPYSCNQQEADKLMKDSIAWFRGEGMDIVGRWAWFGAFDNMKNWDSQYDMDGNRIANADGTINDRGKTYLSL